VSALLLQLTDRHIGAQGAAADPLDTLRAVLAAVRALLTGRWRHSSPATWPTTGGLGSTRRCAPLIGELGPERLAWIAAELDARPGTPTRIATHHPPFPSGMAEMDRIGLGPADRERFTGLLAGHPQVGGVIAGHVHRAIVGSVAGRPAVTIPSTLVPRGDARPDRRVLITAPTRRRAVPACGTRGRGPRPGARDRVQVRAAG
jgi:hypothetical protein